MLSASWRIIEGDCRDTLASLDAGSVQIERRECAACGNDAESYARPGRCVDQDCDGPMVRVQYVPARDPYRFWWGETSSASSVAARSLPLTEILDRWVPGSMPQPWTWDDEERAIFKRVCLCCGQVGHHQRNLEAFLAEHGLTYGVCLGECGRVFDGHHRIVAARRLGIETIPLESLEDSAARWIRDHGPVSWENRKTGDIPANLYRPRNPLLNTHAEEAA